MKTTRKDSEHLIDRPAVRQHVAGAGSRESEGSRVGVDITKEHRLTLSLLKGLKEGIALVDREGKQIQANDELCKMTGFSEEELLGQKPPFKYWAEEGLKEINDAFEKTLEGVEAEYELIFKRKNAERFTALVSPGKAVDADGNDYFFATIRDISERKQAEEALRESEKNLRTYLESAPDGVYINDLKGTFLYGNKKAEEITGYKREELVGKSFLKLGLLPAKHLAKAAQLLALNAIGRATGPDEIELIRKDGSHIWTEINTAPIKQQGKSVVIGFVRDITERKQMEHDIGERLKELQCLYSISQISERAEISLNEVCQEVADLLPPGWHYPEITCSRITVNEDAFQTENYRDTEWKQCADIKVRGVKTGMVEVGYLEERPAIDEGPFLKEERALINAVAEHLAGIIQRKQMEEALRESEERYRCLIELGGQVGEAVIMLQDSEQGEGIQTFVSDEWPRITGYSKEELLGMSFFDLVSPSYREASIERHRQKMAGESAPGLFEITIIRKDTSELTVELTSAYTTYQGKRANVAFIRKVEERKKHEEQIARTQRLAAIGELVSGVAHEINNPLTGIIGFAELVLEKNVPDDIKEDVAIIHHEAKRAAGVIENLLTFARKHKPKKQLININSIVAQVLRLRAYEHKVDNIQVTTHFATNLPAVMADASQLQQVFLNIIINAEHAMADTGGKNLVISTEQMGDMVRVAFTDDGSGISPENLNHIFDPFFTTKEPGKGTGLGLSVCHGMVTEHGGRIYAESEPGKGATFVVELPIVTIDVEGGMDDEELW